MKKFLVAVLFLVVFVVAAAAVFIKLFAAEKIKEAIEEKGSAAVHGDITVGDVKIGYWPPFTIDLVNLTAEAKLPFAPEKPKAGVAASIPMVHTHVDWRRLVDKKIFADVVLQDPKITVVVEPGATGASILDRIAKATRSKVEKAPLPVAIGGSVRVIGGTLDISQIAAPTGGQVGQNRLTMSQWESQIQIPDLAAPVVLDGTANVALTWSSSLPPRGFSFPASKIHSTFMLDDGVFETSQLILDFAGLDADMKGRVQLAAEDCQAQVLITVPNVGTLPLTPDFLPAGTYAGELDGKLVLQYGKQTGWDVTGDGKLQKFSVTDLNYKVGAWSATGTVQGNGDATFTFKKAWTFSNLGGDLDLTAAAVSDKGQFEKTAGVPLKGSLTGNETARAFAIQNAQADLGPLRMLIKGDVGVKNNRVSDLQIAIPKAQAAGLEKIFPSPGAALSGLVDLNVRLRGDLDRPRDLAVNIGPLKGGKTRGCERALRALQSAGKKSLGQKVRDSVNACRLTK